LGDNINFVPEFFARNCSGVTNIYLGKSINNIGGYAFDSCSELSALEIPGHVKIIQLKAFQNCFKLTRIAFSGNAPQVDHSFLNDSNAVAYYLPGTTGWGPTLDSVPTTLLILPYPVILEASTGVSNNQGFNITISWATNATILTESAGSLSNPQWNPVSTNALIGGVANVMDPYWTNSTSGYYRIRSVFPQ
jgi:hypothetical protein